MRNSPEPSTTLRDLLEYMAQEPLPPEHPERQLSPVARQVLAYFDLYPLGQSTGMDMGRLINMDFLTTTKILIDLFQKGFLETSSKDRVHIFQMLDQNSIVGYTCSIYFFRMYRGGKDGLPLAELGINAINHLRLLFFDAIGELIGYYSAS